MADRKIIRRIHQLFWFAITILTGILAGFLTSHSVMLGRFFTWLIESGNYQVFTDVFSVFRHATRANVHYNPFLWASLIIGIIWTILCFIVKQNRITALIAGLSSFWVGCVLFASGFSEAEEAVATGVADEAVRHPMHRSFAVFYAFCLFLLLLSGSRLIHPNAVGTRSPDST